MNGRSPTAFWRARLSGVRTRRLLETHLVVVLVCSVVAVSTLLVSYRHTQRAAETLADRQAPAVQGLAATRLAVLRAHWEVQNLVDLGLVDVAGAGEQYRAQLSAADQGLSRTGDRTDQDLGTVNGLFTTYSTSITSAMTLYHDQPIMQEHKRKEARSLLVRARVGLVPRLDELQRQELDRASATATMGWAQRGGWWLAEAALLALALTLLSALFVLRDRCGRDWNPYLLVALVLTVLFAVVPLVTVFIAQDRLDDVRAGLGEITQASRAVGFGPELVGRQEALTGMSEVVRQDLAVGARTGRVYQGAVIGGLLIVVLPAVGLWLRLGNDYWRRR
ncbi:hypothetical protein [Streptomyces broussonetiae]|uniref:Uncharacterized protein n=1 Tax=Streptomyces broussonetiae TaxID=2686304 RepID=A0ABV5E4K0_9ACTN